MKNKEKYSLDKLIVSVTYEIVGIASIKIYHGIKRVYYKSYDVEEFALRWITDFIKWLEKDDGKEYKPQILTDKEKAYLSAIIKPFGNKKIMIGKLRHLFGEEEYIWIDIDGYHFTLPHFKKGEMYKGMELNKFYTSEELGL